MKNKILLVTLTCVLSACATTKKDTKIPETSYEFCNNYQLVIIANKPSFVERVSVDQPDKVTTHIHGKNVVIVQPNHDLDESEKKDRPTKIHVFLVSDENKKERSISNFSESDCKTSKTYFIGN